MLGDALVLGEVFPEKEGLDPDRLECLEGG